MAHWIIKSKPNCVYCDKAKVLLTEQGVAYEEQHHDTEVKIAAFRNAGFKTFPQVFCDGHLIGGYTELVQYFANSEDI